MVKNDQHDEKNALGAWMTGKARTASGIRQKIISGGLGEDRATSHPTVGKLYFYWYDPKHKATLPIYDRFPLTMPLDRTTSGGFLGINFHYLDPGTRKAILMELLKYKTNRFMDERTRINASYELLHKVRLTSAVAPAIKSYLLPHLRSQFVEVTPREYDKAINLPVAQFIRNHV